MSGPFRLLVTIIAGGVTLLAGMTVLGTLGITQTFLHVPISVFITMIAIWPIVGSTMPGETFSNWLAYQLTVAVVLGVLIAAVELYQAAAAAVN